MNSRKNTLNSRGRVGLRGQKKPLTCITKTGHLTAPTLSIFWTEGKQNHVNIHRFNEIDWTRIN